MYISYSIMKQPMELIQSTGVKRFMVEYFSKAILFRFVAALTVVLLLGVLIFPALVDTQTVDCDDECDDHCESICGCIGCPPAILSFEISPPDHGPALGIQSYSIISLSIDIEYEYLDRVDRPPQTLL